MFYAGPGTWHCHCHSTGLSHVLGQEPCCKLWGLECDRYIAGHPQHSLPNPSSPGSCQARQKVLSGILNEGSGIQQGSFALGEGCHVLLGDSFCPKGTAALLAIDQAPPKYSNPCESYKIWILAAHAGRDDAVTAQQIRQRVSG